MSENHRVRTAKARRRKKRNEDGRDHRHARRYDDVVAAPYRFDDVVAIPYRFDDVVAVPYWEYPEAAKRAAEASTDASMDVQACIDALMRSPIRVGPLMTADGPGYPLTTFGEWAAEAGWDVESHIYFLEKARKLGCLGWSPDMRAYLLIDPALASRFHAGFVS